MRRCGFLAKRTRLIPGLAAFIALPVVPAAAQGPVPPAGQSPAQSQTPQFGTAGSNALQTRRRPPVPTGPAPKTADGKPDLSGAWEPNAFRENVDLISTGVEVPFQPWAEELYKKRRASFGKDDPEARCLPPGVPRMSTTPYPFRIVQTPGLTVIVYEGGAHVWRQIFTDGRPHPKDPNPSWLGDSIGHWEDDTLVIDTIAHNGLTWIDAAGIPASDQLHVTERIRRPDLGHLEIEHIIEDPKTFTRPWKFTTHPQMLSGELMEYICQENNKDVEHLVGK
jgi:hypothetical protein